MKSDLDNLMQTRNFDALIILGDAQHNPPMFYLTGGGHINNAILVKRIGKEAILFCNDMEREEGLRTGLEVHCFSEFPYDDLLKEAKGDPILAGALRLKLMLTSLGLKSGNVSLYGQTDFGSLYATFNQLQKIMPEINFIGEPRDASIFLKAMETKKAS